MKLNRIGIVYKKELSSGWWHSHTMAPTAIVARKGTIRVYIGCWDAHGISRIGYVDLSESDPVKITGMSAAPLIDIGRPGTFDENGVFPGHATVINNKVYLYYTGFQLGHKIRHYNFGGLALSALDTQEFNRVSEAPVLDRSDEGLYVRAGQSVLYEDNNFLTCYSAGSGWVDVAGKPRPVYDVFFQKSSDGVNYQKNGTKIISHDADTEYALGRPQLTKIRQKYYVFYTRRCKDGSYQMGCASSMDAKTWQRVDHELEMNSGGDQFDSQEKYFPSVVYSPETDRYLLFYSGNGFGQAGFGVAEIKE